MPAPKDDEHAALVEGLRRYFEQEFGAVVTPEGPRKAAVTVAEHRLLEAQVDAARIASYANLARNCPLPPQLDPETLQALFREFGSGRKNPRRLAMRDDTIAHAIRMLLTEHPELKPYRNSEAGKTRKVERATACLLVAEALGCNVTAVERIWTHSRWNENNRK